MIMDFARPAPEPALTLDLAVRLADRIIDFEVEQIARQIRATCGTQDRPELARYYYAKLVDRLAERLGGDYGPVA